MSNQGFQPSLHPRHGDGKFAQKANAAPSGSLAAADDVTKPHVDAFLWGADGRAQVTEDEVRAVIETAITERRLQAGPPIEELGYEYADAIQWDERSRATITREEAGKLISQAVRDEAERAIEPPSGPAFTEQVRQVVLDQGGGMGWEELRALDDRTLAAAHETALLAAERLQEVLAERGAAQAKRVVDFDRITEGDLSRAVSAARDQLGAVGQVRTREAFLTHAVEAQGAGPEVADSAWEHFVSAGGSDGYTSATEESEWRAFDYQVDRSLQAIRDGWQPDPWARRDLTG